VAIFLRSTLARDPAAAGAQYAAWITPADGGPIRELLRDLRLPPYGELDSLTDAARRYWPWLAAMLTLLLLLAAAVLHMLRVNRRLELSRSYLERARQLEGQMAHVGRIAAMGEMATTLAHELSQPLAAIVNYARGSIRRVRSEGMSENELIPILERIATEGTRSAEILARLRDFLRKRKPAHVQADINRIVSDAAVLAEVEARQKAVTVRLDLAEAPEPVFVDAIQIEQVVLNLVHNAIEAIDDARWPRREVVIETRPKPGKGVEVTVRDTGPGFPKNDTERMFEPFVSTKPGGMGLGLSISRSIVEAHGDSLRAMLSPEGGAVFYFTLRAFNRAPAQ
jgi:two-component system sensor histidine kinase TtrS